MCQGEGFCERGAHTGLGGRNEGADKLLSWFALCQLRPWYSQRPRGGEKSLAAKERTREGQPVSATVLTRVPKQCKAANNIIIYSPFHNDNNNYYCYHYSILLLLLYNIMNVVLAHVIHTVQLPMSLSDYEFRSWIAIVIKGGLFTNILGVA